MERHLNKTKRHIKLQNYGALKGQPIFYLHEVRCTAKPLKKYVEAFDKKDIHLILLRMDLTYDIGKKVQDVGTAKNKMLGIYACADVELKDFILEGEMGINIPSMMVCNIIKYGKEHTKKQRNLLIATEELLK